MLDTLFPDGSTADFRIEYDPTAQPSRVESDPWSVSYYYAPAPVSIYSPAGLITGVVYDFSRSDWLVYDWTAAPAPPYNDRISWRWRLSSDPCPTTDPCLRDTLECFLDELYDLSILLADYSASACDSGPPPTLVLSDWDVAYFALIHSEVQCPSVLGSVVQIEPWEPPDMLSALVDKVMELNVKSGIANSLDAKLASALEAVDDVNEQNDVSACNRTQAFIKAVEAQRGTQITDADADALIAAAQEIITDLGCQ